MYSVVFWGVQFLASRCHVPSSRVPSSLPALFGSFNFIPGAGVEGEGFADFLYHLAVSVELSGANKDDG